MNKHVTDEQLIDYLLHTVDYTTQQQIEQELETCTSCQRQLRTLLVEYRAIEDELVGQLAQKRPREQANFALLAPQLKTDHWWREVPMKNFAYVGITALLLIIAFMAINNSPKQVSLYQPSFEPPATEHEPTAIPSEIEVVPVAVERVPLDSLLRNGNFEDSQNGRLSGWTRTGSAAHEYETKTDTTIVAEGTTSGYFASNSESTTGFGLIKQAFPADGYQGQRIRLSAQLKTEDVAEQTGLWALQSAPNLDDTDWMQEPLLTGTNDWQAVELIWDVSQNARTIEIGLVLFGAGRVWIDDVQLELVDTTTPIAGHENKLWWSSDYGYQFNLSTQFSNLDFEDDFVRQDTGWTLEDPRYYGIKYDEVEFVTGLASARMESTRADNTNEAGALFQTIKAEHYRGQRLRLTGQLKTEAVEDWTGLVMRVADSSNETLSFDSLQKYAITGDTDWKRYEIVLDVPENSATISVGLILEGKGTVWLDDVQIEVVTDDVSTTSIVPLSSFGEHNSDGN